MNRTAATVRARIEKTSPAPAGDFSGVIRARIGEDLIARLDRIEALTRGNGLLPAATRSTLIRIAVERYVSAIEEALAPPPIGGDDE